MALILSSMCLQSNPGAADPASGYLGIDAVSFFLNSHKLVKSSQTRLIEFYRIPFFDQIVSAEQCHSCPRLPLSARGGFTLT